MLQFRRLGRPKDVYTVERCHKSCDELLDEKRCSGPRTYVSISSQYAAQNEHVDRNTLLSSQMS